MISSSLIRLLTELQTCFLAFLSPCCSSHLGPGLCLFHHEPEHSCPTFTVYCSSCLQLSSCLSFSSWCFLSLSGHSANVSVFWVFLDSGSSYASHLWGKLCPLPLPKTFLAPVATPVYIFLMSYFLCSNFRSVFSTFSPIHFLHFPLSSYSN